MSHNKKIGKIKLGKVIGRGAFAEV